ncbi:type IV secretory system conjugative DNA transfer family protein [Streptosporangium sp. NPDC004631]
MDSPSNNQAPARATAAGAAALVSTAVPGQDWMPGHNPAAVQALAKMWRSTELGDVDRARISRATRQATTYPQLRTELCEEILIIGPAAAVHASGQRDLPAEPPRVTGHNLELQQVRLGRVVPHRMNRHQRYEANFGIDLDCLRTNLLVIGPPGSGKTRSLALPLVEHLALEALANAASVVVIDPKGDDFDLPGWFDLTIDPLVPDSAGLSLYGAATGPDGNPNPEIAADQIASALLPVGVSADKQYFMDASRNALYNCLAPFQAGYQRWPTIRELLNLLREDKDSDSRHKLREALNKRGKKIKKEYEGLLKQRETQLGRREDPAASLIERLSWLDRPTISHLFDKPDAFTMTRINQPLRVRVVLREPQLPEASRFLARLVVSQFTYVVCDQKTNRGIFKGLLVDEAGRFVDEYVAHAMERARSNNAGLMLFSQSLGDFPDELLPRIFGSAGGKVAFGGMGPSDADIFSRYWGETITPEYSYATTITNSPDGTNRTLTETTHNTYRARWTPGELSTDLPPGHAIIQLRRSTGQTALPELVNLR